MTDEQNSYPEGWKPEKDGDRIAGKVVDISLNDGGYGPYPILSLETDQGVRNVHAYHTVLKTELARRRPKVGDMLEITYKGRTADTKERRGYHGYRVNGGQLGTVNWDAFLPDSEREMAAAMEVPIDTAGLPEPVTVPPEPTPDDLDPPF